MLTRDHLAEMTDDLDLTDEDRIHLAATLILLTEGGPLTDHFLTIAPLDVQGRSRYLAGTLAVPAAELMLS
jgi:hypothetical protein